MAPKFKEKLAKIEQSIINWLDKVTDRINRSYLNSLDSCQKVSEAKRLFPHDKQLIKEANEALRKEYAGSEKLEKAFLKRVFKFRINYLGDIDTLSFTPLAINDYSKEQAVELSRRICKHFKIRNIRGFKPNKKEFYGAYYMRREDTIYINFPCNLPELAHEITHHVLFCIGLDNPKDSHGECFLKYEKIVLDLVFEMVKKGTLP